MTKTETERLRGIEDALLLLPIELKGIHKAGKETVEHLEMINGSLGNLDERVGDIEIRHKYQDKQEEEDKEEDKESTLAKWRIIGYTLSVIAASSGIAAVVIAA